MSKFQNVSLTSLLFSIAVLACGGFRAVAEEPRTEDEVEAVVGDFAEGEAAPAPVVVEVYDLTGLIDEKDPLGSEIIIDMIAITINPDSWVDNGGGGTAKLLGKKLIVRQPAETQKRIGLFIAQLKKLPLPGEPAAATRTRIVVGSPLAGDEGKLELAIYPVADILAKQRTELDALVESVLSTVDPDSWEEAGGYGSAVPFPGRASLVIFHSTETHAQIIKLLTKLRAGEEPAK